MEFKAETFDQRAVTPEPSEASISSPYVRVDDTGTPDETILSPRLNIGFKERMHYVLHDEEVVTTREVSCWAVNSERKFLLYRENPLLLSIFSGTALYQALQQASKLWPEERPKLQLAFSALSLVGMTIGLAISGYSLAHSKQHKELDYPFARVKRFWMSALEGYGAVSAFILSESILRYCSDPNHWASDPNNPSTEICDVSDQYLETHFLPLPLIMGTLYTLWHTISADTKEAWIANAQGKRFHYFIKSFVYFNELGFKALLYSRHIQAFCQSIALFSANAMILTNISKTPNPVYYEIPAIIGGGLTVSMQVLRPQHRQKLFTLMMYLYTLVLCAFYFNDMIREYSTTRASTSIIYAVPSAMIKVFALSISLIGGAYLTRRYGGEIHREVGTKQELIAVGYPSLLKGQWNDEALHTNKELIEQTIAAEVNARLQVERESYEIKLNDLERAKEAYERKAAELDKRLLELHQTFDDIPIGTSSRHSSDDSQVPDPKTRSITYTPSRTMDALRSANEQQSTPAARIMKNQRR